MTTRPLHDAARDAYRTYRETVTHWAGFPPGPDWPELPPVAQLGWLAAAGLIYWEASNDLCRAIGLPEKTRPNPPTRVNDPTEERQHG